MGRVIPISMALAIVLTISVRAEDTQFDLAVKTAEWLKQNDADGTWYAYLGRAGWYAAVVSQCKGELELTASGRKLVEPAKAVYFLGRGKITGAHNIGDDYLEKWVWAYEGSYDQAVHGISQLSPAPGEDPTLSLRRNCLVAGQLDKDTNGNFYVERKARE
ncbi:hypothetical protein IHQ71_26715 [Rhizobium sp. TH2]|uniref:hypothetical protein n=1 Tax=Rhizobium sp. TH2 TaxID=2775403 RepID=UPI00215846DB|nr:hypothetical protein [Rhizobium sp. TH2]UVC08678.1 hypothetical protein IHQ71_26715 [Rhizobium sp. TH2]